MAKQPLTRQGRQVRSALKANHLREIAEQRWVLNDLLTLFGMAFKAKFDEQPSKHMYPGKHFRNAHGAGHYSGSRGNQHNPAGTKLVRKFIRHSGKESTFWRNAYKALTGNHYGAVEA